MKQLRITLRVVAAGITAVLIVACSSNAEERHCPPDVSQDGALKYEEDVVTLLQTSSRTAYRRSNGETQTLQEASRILEEDTRTLHNLMSRQVEQQPDLSLHIDHLEQLSPRKALEEDRTLSFTPAASRAQTETFILQKELQAVMQQRDVAMKQAEENAQSLSFVKGELQLALMQESRREEQHTRIKADSAVLVAVDPGSNSVSVAPKSDATSLGSIAAPSNGQSATAAAATASPASDSSDECPPDVITFHCKVSVPVGIAIWVAFFLSILCCCCFLTFSAYRTAEGFSANATLREGNPAWATKELDRFPGGQPRQQGRM